MPNTKDWGKEDEKNYGLLHTEINGEIIFEKYPSLKGNYGLFYENLYDAIFHHAHLNGKAEQAFNTIRLVELAFESSRQKHRLACDNLLPVAY